MFKGVVYQKKLYMYASEFNNHFTDSIGFGWNHKEKPTFDWNNLVTKKVEELKRLEKVYTKNLKLAGVELINGFGSLKDEHTVLIDNKQEITAQKIVISTGGTPFIPPIDGKEHIITSDNIFDIKSLPKDIVIIGAGYIAVEFASIFNSFGSNVTSAIREPGLTLPIDNEVCDFAQTAIANRGVNLKLNTVINKITKQPNGRLFVEFSNGESGEFDTVLSAAGRMPNHKKLKFRKCKCRA